MLFEKKCFNTETPKGNFMRKNLDNALNSEGFLLHLEGTPSHYLFQLFLKL